MSEAEGSRVSRAARRAATAQRILDAARAEFGQRGLEAATIRRIAQRANVDPSLVMQHYGSKAALFAVAIQLGCAHSFLLVSISTVIIDITATCKLCQPSIPPL